MKKFKIGMVVASLFLATALQAQVDVSSKSLQKVKTSKGYEWKKPSLVIPGTIIRYVNTLINNGKKSAENLEVINNISKYMELVPGSVKCEGGCDITYAVNIKEGYKKVSDLYIIDSETKKRRLAEAKDYVSIKWVIKTLDSDKTKTVQYESKLK